MPRPKIVEAARLLAAARIARRSFGGLPDNLRPTNEVSAYEMQDAVREVLVCTDLGRTIGFKLGCTTPVMQRELGINHPCAGYMYQGGLLQSGMTMDRRKYVRPGVECEMAVTMGQRLCAVDGPFDRASIMGAVASVHVAIELMDERYDDWSVVGAGTLIADDFFQAGLVLGPGISEWRKLTLQDLRGVARVNGKIIGQGRGADIMGHPLAALEWLANHCARRGTDLLPGSIISLGSVIGAWWLSPGEIVEMEFESLGALQLRYL